MSKYIEASNILELCGPQACNINNLIFKSNYQNKKELYAIVKETQKKNAILTKLIKKSKINRKHVDLKNKFLCKVLIYDLIFGHGIDSSEKLKKIIKPFTSELITTYNAIDKDSETSNEISLIKNLYPRFVRFNPLVKLSEEILLELRNQGFLYKEFQWSAYDKFIECIQSLKSCEFVKDMHINDLYIFSSESKLHHSSLYASGSIILQDKASCVPAVVLNTEVGSHVIDACAAPGNKTTHIAALNHNRGKIFAFERNEKRFKSLQSTVLKANALCVESFHSDFLKCDPTDPRFHKVKYILVDPSCSGSGILNRVGEKPNCGYDQRLRRLSNIQAMLLKHALSFPRVHAVVYATCSLNHQENEHVVMETLHKYAHVFELAAVLPSLPNRGDTRFGSDADKCLYMRPSADLTNGFFVAKFVRKSRFPLNYDLKRGRVKSEIRGEGIKFEAKMSKVTRNQLTESSVKRAQRFSDRGLLKKRRTNKKKHPIMSNIAL